MSKSIQLPGSTALADNDQYIHRFEIPSETSNRKYVVAQRRSDLEWCCSCPAWTIKKPGKDRTCKHLRAMMPYLVQIGSGDSKPKMIESKEEKGRKIKL